MIVVRLFNRLGLARMLTVPALSGLLSGLSIDRVVYGRGLLMIARSRLVVYGRWLLMFARPRLVVHGRRLLMFARPRLVVYGRGLLITSRPRLVVHRRGLLVNAPRGRCVLVSRRRLVRRVRIGS
jgi:hypothetical protein